MHAAGAHDRKKKTPQTVSFEGASVDPTRDFNHGLSSQSESDEEGEILREDINYPQAFWDYLGAGNISYAQIFQIFFLIWGLSGCILNRFLGSILAEPFLFLWISLAGAFFLSAAITRIIGKFFWKRASSSQINAGPLREDLIGCEGRAIYRVTLEDGMAQVYDDRGILHRISCRIEPKGNVIQEGDRILIVGYDSGEDQYLVK